MEILEQDVPLRTDEHGVVRVGNTRVLFALVVRSFRRGHTPEEIVRQYTTLSLADTYGAVSYYLQHQNQVEDYLEARNEKAEEVRRKLEEAGGAVEAGEFLARKERSQ